MEIIHEIYSSHISELLERNNAVAIFQGRSEAGPRALGNRSILFNPSIKDGRLYINRIKKREHWRPFAGVILHEYASDWFDMKNLEESPFMSYAIPIKDDSKLKYISSIVHDNTCRIQTLKREQNPNLYDIINCFYNGGKNPPIIGNTSLNLAGYPLVETKEQSIEILLSTELEYLYFADEKELIFCKNSVNEDTRN